MPIFNRHLLIALRIPTLLIKLEIHDKFIICINIKEEMKAFYMKPLIQEVKLMTSD